MLLIDSSVIVKYVSREPGWQDAEKYVAEARTIHLALAELGNALLKKLNKKEIQPSTAANLLAEYSIRTILFDENKYLVTALDIALATKSAIYDSLFIATALEEGCDLVSCDKRQLDIANGLGVKTIEC